MRCPACGDFIYFDWCDTCGATLEDILGEDVQGGFYDNDIDLSEDDYDYPDEISPRRESVQL